jgi:hypothetical protein
MARKSHTINKARLKEDIATLKTAVAVLELEVTLLNPGENERHKMRLQSILGASVVMGIAEALGSVESAFKACRTIKKETTS